MQELQCTHQHFAAEVVAEQGNMVKEERACTRRLHDHTGITLSAQCGGAAQYKLVPKMECSWRFSAILFFM